MEKKRLLELAGMPINEAMRDAVQELAVDHIKMAKEFLEDDKAEGYDNTDVLRIAKDNLKGTVEDVIQTMEEILKK